MIPELGHYALALATILAFTQCILPLWGAWRRDARLMASAGPLACAQLLALMVAAFALVESSVVSDFSVTNVYQNSASTKPLIYKITGTWGNHEGSILLWAMILGLCGVLVAWRGRNLPSSLLARVLGVLGGTSAGFLLYAVLVSNPLLRTWPAPVEGQGMNPLLQDPGLAVHPPILYLGYVGFAVPFAFAVAALLEGRIDAAWGRWVRPWALLSWCFLTCGIALGSWWAYYELGWGGYWFWDPVENASLLPWLTGTALVHSAIVVEKREALKIWTVLLAIGTFSLSLSGTFLVRSGILNSVHSFTNDPDRGEFILALLAIVIGGSLVLFAYRAPKLAAGGVFAPLSREGALILNNLFLVSIATVVLIGTLYPPFADLLFGAKISVGAPFFQATVLPLAAPLIVVMTIGPVLPWKRAQFAPAARRLWIPAVIALAVGIFATSLWQWLPGLAFAGAAWLILGAFGEIIERIKLCRVPFVTSLSRLGGISLSTWGSAAAHAGFGVTIAGIAAMSLATSQVVSVPVGATQHMAGYDWKLVSLETLPGPNYISREATIEVSHNGKLVTIMHPARHNFVSQQQTTTDTAIHTMIYADLYAVLGDDNGTSATLRLHYNLGAPLIWLGGLIMALGGLCSLVDRRLRVGVPARKTVAVTA